MMKPSSKCGQCGHMWTRLSLKSLDMCAHWVWLSKCLSCAQTQLYLVSALYRLTNYIFIPNTREMLGHWVVHIVHIVHMSWLTLVLGAQQ